MSWQFTVGLRVKRTADRIVVHAEDALIAALKVKAERPEATLASSRDGIIAKYVGLQFDFVKSMFENVADANNSHKLIAFLDGQVANASLRHEFHYMGNAMLGRADNDHLRHKPGNCKRWQLVAMCRQSVGQVTLGNDAIDGPAVTAHNHGPDLLCTQLH